MVIRKVFMKLSSFYTSLRVFSWLLWCDMRLVTKDFWNNLLDASFWPLVLIAVHGYVLPAMGLPNNYGGFTSISMLIIMASFTAWAASNVLTADLEGPRSISYELTLPLPYWLVYVKIALHFALKATIFNINSLIIGKIIVPHQFDLSNISPFLFLFVYMVACLFFGFFALWAACFAGTVQWHQRLETRLAGPLFFICGYSFPWLTLNTLSPLMGKLMLLTPWIYAYEGTRATILGQSGFIDYKICILMLLAFATIFGTYGLRLFKKRLDCV
jgi:ABC-type multidrug transport system permease subunit